MSLFGKSTKNPYAWVLGVCVMTLSLPAWSFFSSDVLKVKLEVVDDKGQVVSFATVGSIIAGPVDSYSIPFNALTPDDLWRIVIRNPSAWEYWDDYVSPCNYLMLTGLTDTAGSLTNVIDYGEIAARKGGVKQSRPDNLTIAYAAYKHGYEPAQQVIVAKKDDQQLTVHIVLKRAADYVAQEKPYLRTLNEVRREISNSSANETVSRKNYKRLEGLRARLEKAAQQAIDANDPAAAAQIFYWVAEMPEISEMDGDLIGYTQSNDSSPRNVAAFKKAVALDPNNVQIQSQWLALEENLIARDHNQLKLTTDAEWTQQRKDWLQRAEKLDKVAGNRLWSNMHAFMANTYGYLSSLAYTEKRYNDAVMYRQKEYEKMLWIQKYDPKWHDYREELSFTESEVKKYRSMANKK